MLEVSQIIGHVVLESGPERTVYSLTWAETYLVQAYPGETKTKMKKHVRKSKMPKQEARQLKHVSAPGILLE